MEQYRLDGMRALADNLQREHVALIAELSAYHDPAKGEKPLAEGMGPALERLKREIDQVADTIGQLKKDIERA